jgi:hypothetical protein
LVNIEIEIKWEKNSGVWMKRKLWKSGVKEDYGKGQKRIEKCKKLTLGILWEKRNQGISITLVRKNASRERQNFPKKTGNIKIFLWEKTQS